MKISALFTIVVLLKGYVFGQNFTNLYGDYLGQTPPSETPVIFAPGIVSNNSLEHSAAIFSSDGNEVYWVSRQNQSSPLDLLFMKRINNQWTLPEKLNLLGDSINLFDPFLTADGKKIYFAADKNGNADLWMAERNGSAWTNPQNLGLPVNNADGQCQVSLTRNGILYYIDYRVKNNQWSCDIVKAKQNESGFQNPDTLPTSINSLSSEDWTPFIAPDESYLIFSSRRDQNYGDLYISFHQSQTDTWSEPVSLGQQINTDSQETFPVVSPDGKYLFFTRWTNEQTDMDVYWVSAKIIYDLKLKLLPVLK